MAARLPTACEIALKFGTGTASSSCPGVRCRYAASAASSQKTMLQVPSSLANVKNIIAVSSCKGGVGKSTVAVNLAFALQKTGAKVGIFDCDIYGPSLPLMVRVEKPQLLMFDNEAKQTFIRPVVHESGMKLISFGYAGESAVMRGSKVTGLITQLMQQTFWEHLDYLVLDMPPGTGDIQLTVGQVCKITAAVIVTTPQKLSVIDVERGITMFGKLDIPSVAVVQNMSYFSLPNGERQYVFGKTDAGRHIAGNFGIDNVFELPLDSAVSAAGDSGVPFVTAGESTAAIEEVDKLAAAVIEEVRKLRSGKRRPVVTYDERAKALRVELDSGEVFGVDPKVLRLRDKRAGGPTAPPKDVKPAEIKDMGNYAVSIRWSDGVVQVTPHRQLLEGDDNGPMPRIEL